MLAASKFFSLLAPPIAVPVTTQQPLARVSIFPYCIAFDQIRPLARASRWVYRNCQIQRIGHGLYTVPKVNRFGLASMPAPETVAQLIADHEGAIIEIHGAEAARRFGFSTQMPAQPAFYTTGSSRTVKLGKLQVRLQHVAARKLALACRPAGQALAALWYLGRNQVTPATFRRIEAKLSHEEFLALRKAKSSMPAWMVESLRQYEAQNTTS